MDLKNFQMNLKQYPVRLLCTRPRGFVLTKKGFLG